MSSSRITKELSGKIAQELTKPHRAELQSLKDEMGKKLTKIVLKKIPKDILNIFEKYPNYFEKKTWVNLHSSGRKYGQYKMTREVPVKNNTYNFSVELTNSEFSKLESLQNKIEEIEKSNKELKEKLKSIIYTLRSYKNIEESLPEAAVFLPKPNEVVSTQLVSLKEIRSQLKVKK